jgi:hypothetical protein
MSSWFKVRTDCSSYEFSIVMLSCHIFLFLSKTHLFVALSLSLDKWTKRRTVLFATAKKYLQNHAVMKTFSTFEVFSTTNSRLKKKSLHRSLSFSLHLSNISSRSPPNLFTFPFYTSTAQEYLVGLPKALSELHFVKNHPREATILLGLSALASLASISNQVHCIPPPYTEYILLKTTNSRFYQGRYKLSKGFAERSGAWKTSCTGQHRWVVSHCHLDTVKSYNLCFTFPSSNRNIHTL